MASEEIRFAIIDEVFGQLLVSQRKRLDLEQAAFAKRCGMSRAALSRLERGDSSASLATIFEIANALEITPSALMQKFEEDVRLLKQREISVIPKKGLEGKDIALGLVGAAALAMLLSGR